MSWITSGATVQTKDEEQHFLDSLLAQAREQPRRQYTLAIVPVGQQEMAGTIRIGVSGDQHRGDIGYALRRSAWGKGYATEAAHVIVRFGFEQLGLHRIFAHVRPDNARSIRVLENCGMQYEGRLREEFKLLDDGWRDSLVYAVLETDDQRT